MEALLRRSPPKNHVEINCLLWNKERFELTYRNNPIKLTPKEFIMLGHFIQNPNQVFAREQLIELIWGFNSETEGRTVDYKLRNRRDKIQKVGFPIDDYFKTEWGEGYNWVKPS